MGVFHLDEKLENYSQKKRNDVRYLNDWCILNSNKIMNMDEKYGYSQLKTVVLAIKELHQLPPCSP